MSQAEGQSKEIAGHTYTVYMLPPKRAMDLLVDLLKVGGPSVGALVDAIKGILVGGGLAAVAAQNIDDVSIADAVKEFTERLSKEQLREVTAILAEVSTVDGQQLFKVFDMHFIGKLGAMLKWVVFALGVQYADFWSEWADSIPGVARVVPMRPSKSQDTSTG